MGLYENKNNSLSLLAGGTCYADSPVGAIFPFGGSIAPSGFLLCNGQAVSRTDYAELFAVIGTSFGAGDGSITFNVPDLRGKFVEGLASGETVGTSKSAGLPNIVGNASLGYNDSSAIGVMTRSANGAFTTQTDGPTYWAGPAGNTGYIYGNSFHFDASKSNSIYGNSSTVQPPAVCVNYIIKAKQMALPIDFEDAVDAKFNALDVASVGGSGKYISAISETDGKISATETALSTTPTNGSAIPITSGGVYSSLAKFTTWTDVTSAAVSMTGTFASNTIRVYTNGYECKIVGEFTLSSTAQSINDGWISSLANISIKQPYRPRYETALSGFFAANHHSPIIWYVIPSGAITGYVATANSEFTSISRIPINGTWIIA